MGSWTKQHMGRLAELWNEGATGGEIAKELNDTMGPLPPVSHLTPPRPITRSMVIAKAKRMGQPGRGSPLKQLAK